jgi:OOP family OmpA-OmpF porin
MGCWVIGKVYFDLDKHAIKPRYTNLLDDVATVMQWNPEVTMNIKGHTDALASEAYNDTLSQQRAMAVKRYLIDAGISADRLETMAFGEDRPTAPNATPEQRSLNRRVELVPDW